MLTIAAVERETGIGKDTLRVWERRYGFPQPVRDPHGDRRYPIEQVEKLRLIRRLLEQGYRPGQIVPTRLAELSALADGESTAVGESAEANEILELLRTHDADALRQRLQQRLVRQGLERFVLDTVAPLNGFVGQAWMRGHLAIFEEHLYTEVVSGLLRTGIASATVPQAPPKILLTTLPGEQHGLGLLMAQVVAALEGATCVSLGLQTPATELAAACRAHRADVVALSFSSAYGARHALASLHDVRARLPLSTRIWAGGGAVHGLRRPPDGTCIVRNLSGLPDMIAQWRALAAPGAGPAPLAG